ncbi:hypothetical protein [Salibacterium halotolerans]|uniref:Uncharacterized protein n=1 Tax=Salibacterium halotolerans TaxID=1884432 RepID=A0A1I5MLJ2_9BACI|nr:hypothetical protein [Salibacterium halotolerans]SFP09816.1 hypothetical protein SAMN05518683_102261 [Salibacterium halotolerans]
MVESAIYIRGRKMPDELWEVRKGQLMEIYRENERLLRDMKKNVHTTPTNMMGQTVSN